MKRVSVWAVWVFVLLVVVVISGCSIAHQPGETVAEGHRRHQRNLRLNQEGLMRDVDSFLLFDKPSSLSNKTIE